jgi:hypothetical protein
MSGGKLIGVKVISGSFTPSPGLKSFAVSVGVAGSAGGACGSYFKVLPGSRFCCIARTIGAGGLGGPKS